MFDFDKTPEQQAAELARWDGIDRRRYSAYTELYVEQFGPRRRDDTQTITDEELQRRCLPYSSYTVQQEQEQEQRHPATGLPIRPDNGIRGLLFAMLGGIVTAVVVLVALYADGVL